MASVLHLRPREEILHCIMEEGHSLRFVNAKISFCKFGPVGRLDLPRHSGVTLFGGLLDMLSIEIEMKPILTTSLEYRHGYVLLGSRTDTSDTVEIFD